MTIRDFFENKGVVRCESSEEDAAVIDLCRQEGLPISSRHDSTRPYWGITMHDGMISGYRKGSQRWEAGTPYCEFLTLCGIGGNLPAVDDLI